MKMLYEVQQSTLCEGWINNWSDGDGIYDTYETKEEAQKEIDDFFEEIQSQIDTGEREADNGYERDEYRVAEITYDAAIKRDVVWEIYTSAGQVTEYPENFKDACGGAKDRMKEGYGGVSVYCRTTDEHYTYSKDQDTFTIAEIKV